MGSARDAYILSALCLPILPLPLPCLSSHHISPPSLTISPSSLIRATEGDCPDQVTLILEHCCLKTEM